MSKSLSKKGSERVERRKTPRRRKATPSKAAPSAKKVTEYSCSNCEAPIPKSERALFVEEEVGRVFCSEDCIMGHFSPDVERMEREYARHRQSGDLSAEERERYAHLRWVTLEEPDEVWRQKTVAGDYRYTFISEFQPAGKKIWCVCISLCLRGEASFLFLAFPTKSQALLHHYRKGEQIEWEKKPKKPEMSAEEGDSAESKVLIDGLGSAWTEEETMRAQFTQTRSPNDISPDEFESYQKKLEPTLEQPDEVWATPLEQGADSEETKRLYHFIRHFSGEDGSYWYVVIAKDTEDEDQIEIVDAFPSTDPHWVDRYRHGKQEVGETAAAPVNRLVH